MSRARKPKNDKLDKARRERVIGFTERQRFFTSTSRKPAAGPTSAAVKIGDPALRALIDEALAKREAST